MAAEDEDVYDGEHMSFHRSTQLCKVRPQQALRNMRTGPDLSWPHEPGGQLRD
jgi:hypothetical protein